MKYISQIFIMTWLVCFPVCGGAEDVKSTPPKTMTIKRHHKTHSLYFSGAILPIKATVVSSPVEGVVSKKFFEYGSMVKKGDSLVSINSNQVQKDYQAALKQYLDAKEKFFSSQAQFEGTKELYGLGIISREEFTNSKNTLHHNNVHYLQSLYALNEILKKQKNDDDLTKLDYSDVKAVDAALRKNHDHVVVTAEADGVALMAPSSGRSGGSESLEEGGQVTLGQALLTLGDLSGIALNIQVTEVDVGQVKAGQKVHITGVAFPGIKLLGEVTHVDVQASAEGSGLPTFAVKVKVGELTEEQQKIIRVGMSAKIQLDIEHPEALQIPIKAVSQKDGKSLVYKLLSNGDKEAVAVKTGKTSLDQVVIEEGLESGDKIIISD